MKHLIIGIGEIGNALHKVLSRRYEVWGQDLDFVVNPEGQQIRAKAGSSALEDYLPKGTDVLHVCLDFHGLGRERFVEIVQGYLETHKPKILDVCSTCTPGTTESFGRYACHSTTRGLHPNLESGLLTIVKHVGGPMAETLAKEYAKAGVRCVTHRAARTTEIAHILNNSAYGVSLMFADEMARLCRAYGVDYFEAVMKYTDTHNQGFTALDHPRLVRSVLTPPQGRIGGHCVTQGASLIPETLRGPMLEALARYRKEDAQAAPAVPELREDGAALPLEPGEPAEGGGLPA